MYTIGLDKARMLVRKNLDEQAENASSMLADVDSEELDLLIDKMLPEAINAVHEAAPIEVLEGEKKNFLRCGVNGDGVGEYSYDDGGILRVVSFKANDSDVYGHGVVDDSSNMGRQQLNPYTRGDAGNPVLVRMPENEYSRETPMFRYYCHQSKSIQTELEVHVILRSEYDSTKSSYVVDPSCKDRAIYYLTGMVAKALGMGDAASHWYNLASF